MKKHTVELNDFNSHVTSSLLAASSASPGGSQKPKQLIAGIESLSHRPDIFFEVTFGGESVQVFNSDELWKAIELYNSL